MEWYEKKRKTKTEQGYNFLYMPRHPSAKKDGYIREHRWVMEKKMRRFLKKTDIVHHINGNRSDNRIENLRVFPGHRAHFFAHRPNYRQDFDINREARELSRLYSIKY